MEIKTCEEYVLARLAEAEAKAEHAEEERKKLLAGAREEIARLQGIIDYSDSVIKELANYVVIKKDENLPDLWSVEPTGYKATLDLKHGIDVQTFIRLAPIIGDAGAKELLQKMVASRNAEVGSEGAGEAKPEHRDEHRSESKKKHVQNHRVDHRTDHKDDHKDEHKENK